MSGFNTVHAYPQSDVRLMFKYSPSVFPAPSSQFEFFITRDGRCWNIYLDKWVSPSAGGEVDIKKYGESYKFLLHRKVAEAFVPNPYKKKYVVFKDSDRTNRHANNLAWSIVLSGYYVGKKYNRLLVLEDVYVVNKDVKVRCKCDCGKIVDVSIYKLKSGHTKSCGCLNYEKIMSRITKHGQAKSNSTELKLYNVWSSMYQRCYNPRNTGYKNYGGRGITVCDEWNKDIIGTNAAVINFVDWAKDNGYSSGLTIDREDNDGNYEPSNCRWVTWKVQLNNRRKYKPRKHEALS